jgi:hypothetical protein
MAVEALSAHLTSVFPKDKNATIIAREYCTIAEVKRGKRKKSQML